ncbi:MAG TPA: TIGR04372 family glycosyltransferase [Gemmataceae bacterium]|nr:TIGR04372 family glycosyltransferase [Gemmataceae bacterium]
MRTLTAKAKNVLRDHPRAWELLGRVRVLISPCRPGSHLALGHALMHQARQGEAVRCYQRGIALAPGRADAYLALGHALTKSQRYDEADQAYQAAIERAPGCVEAYQGKINALWWRGRKEDALALYHRALALRPDSDEIRCGLASALAALGRDVEATEQYRIALAHNPTRAEAHLGLGWLLLEKQGRPDEAVEAFRQAVTHAPQLVGAHTGLGHALFRLNRPDEAVEAFRQALSLDPEGPDVVAQIGFMFALLGWPDEAEACWQRAITLAPERWETYYCIWMGLAYYGWPDLAVGYYKQHRALQQARCRQAGVAEDDTRYVTEFWSCNIGHTTHLDCYFKIAQLGWRPPARTVLLARPDQVANPAYLACWRPYLDVVTDPDRVAELLPRARDTEAFVSMNDLSPAEGPRWAPQAAARVQKQWEAEGRGPLLALSDADRERGWRCLESFGVPRGAWFATLHARESGFHGHTEQCFRNADVESYLPAVRAVTARGGWVIRLGDPAMKPLPPMPNVLDYPHTDAKSDWMDVFLAAACRFVIGTQSGMSLVPSTFGVPCAMTNWVSLGTPPWYGNDLFLPKLFWSEPEGRLLTFAEVLDSRMALTQDTRVFDQHGVRLVENTADEISDLVVEMLDRLEGAWRPSPEDEQLQAEFRRLCEARDVCLVSRVGAAFLRRHRRLLEERPVAAPRPAA